METAFPSLGFQHHLGCRLGGVCWNPQSGKSQFPCGMSRPTKFISYHIISYRVISYHIISYHIISCHSISYHTISYHIISCHIISYHIASYHIISLYHIISYHIISYHIISYHIISHHTMPYIIMLQHNGVQACYDGSQFQIPVLTCVDNAIIAVGKLLFCGFH